MQTIPPDLGEKLRKQVQDALAPYWPDRLGVAVSGGGDSVALLRLAKEISDRNGGSLKAVTIDHGLRAGSDQEAQTVAALCAQMNVPHQTLRWEDWTGQGNLQNAAREARYALIADWAKAAKIGTVALGHTEDDQAETVLMRLARRSGVDGLAGMSPRKLRHGISWVRPLLSSRRADLRSYLRGQGISWAEDPSNDDAGFDRVKARKALAELSILGLTPQSLAVVAENMGQVRKALNWQAFVAFREMACVDAGAVVISARHFRTLPDEIKRRLLIHALGWISGQSYPPRRASVMQMMHNISSETTMTLEGCQMQLHRGHIWLFREPQVVRDLVTSAFEQWDNRWRLHCIEPQIATQGLELRALGEAGLGQCPDWRETGRPRAMLLGSPSIWRGGEMLAAPLANPAGNWRAELNEGEEAFFAALLSH